MPTPAHASTPLAYPQPLSMVSLWTTAAPAEPASAQVVAAVLQFGDVREEREDGATLVRFSAARLDREDMRLLLGAERLRALDISVIWDEQEEQLVRVLDAAPLRPAAPAGTGREASGNRYADARKRGSERLRSGYGQQASAA